MMLRSVLLPLPEGPMIPTNSPSETSKDTSVRAVKGDAPSYVFQREETSSTSMRTPFKQMMEPCYPTALGG